MKLLILPSHPCGCVTPPPSKSLCHRAAIASALAGSELQYDAAMGEDVLHTCEGVQRLLHGEHPTVDCGESGTTLRFLIPLAMLRGGARFLCRGRLADRPLPPYAAYRRSGRAVEVFPPLSAGRFVLPGNISSQFISALFFALPLLPQPSEIVPSTPVESGSYLTMTGDVLRSYGISVEKTENGWYLPGGQHYSVCDCPIEADWSAASAFVAMNALGGEITLRGLRGDSRQGDRLIAYYAASLPDRIDISDCPDLAPNLAALAALQPDRTVTLTHAGRLALKESNRLVGICRVLSALGGSAECGADSLTVRGKALLSGGTVFVGDDHRLAMMAAVLSLRCSGAVTLCGAESTAKSYPRFWDDCRSLGISVSEVKP